MFEDAKRRLINGRYSNSSKVIARCHLLTHRGYLTKALVKSHSCISKKCPFLEKTKPEYWESLEAFEETKKRSRLERKQAQEATNDRDKFIRKILEDCGHIYVTAIRDINRNFLEICYIYDERVDLTQEIRFLQNELGKAIRLKARNGSDDAIELLIRKRNTSDLQ